MMRYLIEEEKKEALYYINKAKNIAKKSNCLRSKSGAVIVRNKNIIGIGYNSPPNDKALLECIKDKLPTNFKSDKTCCVHAEQRAILDALRGEKDLRNSRLYYIRLDLNNNIIKSGDPYCTICSKLSLDSGISEFILYKKEGIALYDTYEYNDLSFKYIP